MAPYNYNNFYDPVGSQSNQPSGYTYSGQQSTANTQYPSQSSSNYQTGYSQNYGNAYTNQQYAPAGQQQHTSSSSNRPHSGVTSLSGQSYGQQSDARPSAVGSTYDNNSYYASSGFATASDRSQANNSPLYATGSASTFGALSLPDQSQASSNTFANSQSYQATPSSTNNRTYRNAPSSALSRGSSYQTAYSQQSTQQQSQQPPQRYASPLHAVQAQQQQQQGHRKQPSRNSNHEPSPQLAARNLQQQQQQQQQSSYQNRQQSTSVEPSPTTVDPSQVYDMRAEQQRKAQIDAERRKKIEAQRKAEEEARAAEEAARKAEEARVAEKERAEREARETEERAKQAEEEAAKKKAAQDKRNEQRRKAREEKRQSKTAATALTQMASGSGNAGGDSGLTGMPGVGDMSGPPANDEEAEMRAMFRKMREFNARNPDMLSRLWEEERKAHAAQSPPQPAKQAQAPPPKPPQQSTSTKQPVQQSNRQPQQTAAAPPAPRAPAQPMPVTHKANNNLWPADKKDSVAAAAAEYLNKYPDNYRTARSISMDEILKILDANPSYVQLCEIIERTGMRMDRSALAKALLSSVPGKDNENGDKANSTTPLAAVSGTAAKVNAPGTSAEKRKPGRPRKDGPTSYHVPPGNRRSTDAGPVAYQAPVFHSLADAARDSTIASAISNSDNNASIHSPSFGPPASNGNSRPQSSYQQVTDVKAESVAPEPAPPPRPPANKEEAARKRTFNDLVDLTTGDSDDEGPPRKIPQLPSGPANGAVKHAPPSTTFQAPMTYQQFIQQNTPRQNMMAGQGAIHPSAPARPPWGTFNVQPASQNAPQIMPSQPAPKPKGPSEEQKQQERMRGKMLVEPIMRDRVARKSKYDSRTIARDLLLATGRHPDMRPLNAHLNTMQKLLGDHGGVVDGGGNKSDLATIRWDIIDPGEPSKDEKQKSENTAESRSRASVIAESSHDREATEEADDEGAAPASASRAPREAFDPLPEEERMAKLREVATDEEWAQIGEESMQKRLKNRYQQRKFRERRVGKPYQGRTSLRGPSIERNEQRRPVEADEDGNRYVSVSEQQKRRDAARYVSVLEQQEKMRGTNPIKRRGRPPKNKERVASASEEVHNDIDIDSDNILQSDIRPAVPASAKSTPKPKAVRGSPAMSSGGGAVGYAAFRQMDENGNIIKKKGRPVGWRKSLHSREAQGLEPIKSGQMSSSSKPKKSLVGSATKTAIVQPQFQVYRCRWGNCTAELDNLDRLKKHIVKLHGAPNSDGDFECRWESCRFAGTHVNANGKAQTGDEGVTSFESIEQWLKHVSKEHIDPVAWKLGDGPRGGSVAESHTDSEAYLSDAHGRSVTPIIVPAPRQEQEQSQPVLQSDVKRIGRPPKDPDERTREAEAQLEKLREQKRAEQWILGQEGSILANAQRRLGFMDDEDFIDFIPSEEQEF